ncbi:hypothetical protein PCASD_07818 [Puccinia coronata f. sp. avenae]|uniref:Uncharacterized protein n=1 Tax=Puccinia coronata f. sp. avenae TaxID=200324 RepID=A0A2N5UQV4_9BASI|nr:hypothetical protein PCASD_26801 [Puccinia coronata f. sp. avenae]PLW40145.1 hypothetical protein PCASD_07818 [Puccinia coronata f. sp. avenae]
MSYLILFERSMLGSTRADRQTSFLIVARGSSVIKASSSISLSTLHSLMSSSRLDPNSPCPLSQSQPSGIVCSVRTAIWGPP